jgi:hypothetical protein
MRRSGTDLAPCLHAHPVYVIDALGDDVEHTRRAQTLLMIERDHGHPWTGVSDFYQIASLPINYLGVTGHAFAQVRQSWPSGGRSGARDSCDNATTGMLSSRAKAFSDRAI